MNRFAIALTVCLMLLATPAAVVLAQAGKDAPDLFIRPIGQAREINIRNLKGNTIILVFLCTAKMVQVAALGPKACSG